MKQVIMVCAGAAIGALATFFILGAKEIDITLLDIETGETAEFCGGTHVQLKVGGSPLNPMGKISCPDDPCGGLVVRDKDGNFVHMLVPGVPVGFDCKAARTASRSAVIPAN